MSKWAPEHFRHHHLGPQIKESSYDHCNPSKFTIQPLISVLLFPLAIALQKFHLLPAGAPVIIKPDFVLWAKAPLKRWARVLAQECGFGIKRLQLSLHLVCDSDRMKTYFCLTQNQCFFYYTGSFFLINTWTSGICF